MLSPFRDLGERVLVLGRLRGRGKGSDIPLNVPVRMLFTVRDGKVIRSHDYVNYQQALEAAGLGEQP